MLDTSDNVIDSFATPDSNPRGLTFDGEHLWNADKNECNIYMLDTSGNIICSTDPLRFCSIPDCITFDGIDLWASYGGYINKFNMPKCIKYTDDNF